jgi:hypothetical protein
MITFKDLVSNVNIFKNLRSCAILIRENSLNCNLIHDAKIHKKILNKSIFGIFKKKKMKKNWVFFYA